VAGVRAAPSSYVLAPTPPPDIDLELWRDSIDRVRAWRPKRLAITHFGCFDDVASHLDAIEDALERSGRLAREGSCEQFVATLAAEIDADEAARGASAYSLGAPLEQCYAGLQRYWAKRAAAP
jgi:hypothetical protein